MLSFARSTSNGGLLHRPVWTIVFDSKSSHSWGDNSRYAGNGKGSGSTQGKEVPEGDRQMVVRETPVPKVLYDRDAPPYFDDPGEEGKQAIIILLLG